MATTSYVDPLLAALRAAHPEMWDGEEKADDPPIVEAAPPPPPPPPLPLPHDWLFVASPPPMSIKRIKAIVARNYRVSVEELESQIRSADIVLPRQIVMYLAKRYAHASLPAIGRVLGGRDHTTVLHGVKRIETQLGCDVEFAERIDKLIAVIFPEGNRD